MSKQLDNTVVKTPAADVRVGAKSVAKPVALIPRGSLPELLGPSDLPNLNLAMRYLFNGLRKAAPLFRDGQHGGRQGAIHAIQTVWLFLTLFEPADRGILWAPLVRLQDALFALDNNNVESLLVPQPRTGRAQASHGRQALMACAAGCVRLLRNKGVDPAKARKWVADKLNDLGVSPGRGPGRVTARTVREWCEKVDADVARRGVTAFFYDSMVTDRKLEEQFADMTAPDARHFLMSLLGNLVRTMRLHETK